MTDDPGAGTPKPAPPPPAGTEFAPVATPPSARSLRDSALKGLCPRCGSPTLFAGWIRFADRCSACGLDFSAFNVGDGPAAFLTLILGTVITALAVWLEVAVAPPFWVHLILWLPLTLVAVLASLRIAKGALMAAEVRNAAREGTIDRRVDGPPA